MASATTAARIVQRVNRNWVKLSDLAVAGAGKQAKSEGKVNAFLSFVFDSSALPGQELTRGVSNLPQFRTVGHTARIGGDGCD